MASLIYRYTKVLIIMFYTIIPLRLMKNSEKRIWLTEEKQFYVFHYDT